MNQSICNAINSRTCLRVVYDGLNRIVEPHAYGVSTAGNEVMRVFQVGGGSASGESVGWKLMAIDQVQGLQATNTPSQAPRPGYKRNDSAMARIYCQI